MNIDKIILKIFRKSESLEELEMLEQWKKESDDNLAFMQMLNLEKSDSYKEFDKEKAWSTVDQKMSVGSLSYLRYAAMLLIAIAAAAASHFYSKSEDLTFPVYKSMDKVEHYVLQDNSTVWMNSNSTIAQISDFKKQRLIEFSGEAYFDVSHQESNPFMININEQEFVRVVGTSFNLKSKGNDFDLVVYSGKVELHSKSGIIELEKDQRVSRVNGSYVKFSNVDINTLSWKTGELVFENVSLEKAFETLEDHYNVDIDYSAISLYNCVWRTRISNQELGAVLNELEELFSMKYIKEGNQIQIEELHCD